jgi:hypothetical protein
MGSVSDYAETEMLKHVLGEGPFTHPDQFMSLSEADILDDASGNDEHSGDNYSRPQVTVWDAGAGRKTANTSPIAFPTASGTWGGGDMTHWGIWDASSGGNLLAHGSLDVAKGIEAGNTPSFAAGEIEISFLTSAAGGGWFDFLVHAMLDHVFEGSAYTPPSIYMTLSTSTPADDGPNVTEPSGNNFARELHAAWDAVVNGASENTGAITFNVPSGTWGLITHMAAFDHLTTSGGPLFWGDVTDQTPETDDTVSIPDGDLDLTIT